MSHLNSHHSLNNSILATVAGVVVPPTSQLSADAHAALVAAASSNRNVQVVGGFQSHPDAFSGRSMAMSSHEEQQHHHRQLLLAHAAAEQRTRALHAARAHAAMAQRQEEDEFLVRLLLHRRQQAAALAGMSGGGGPIQDCSLGQSHHGGSPASLQGSQGLGSVNLGESAAPSVAGHQSLWGYGNVNAANVSAVARLQAHRELQMMDRNAIFLEEARARQGLRTLAYIHPQTGLAMPSSSAGNAGLAALQGYHLQQQQQQHRQEAGKSARVAEERYPVSSIRGEILNANQSSTFVSASVPVRAFCVTESNGKDQPEYVAPSAPLPEPEELGHPDTDQESVHVGADVKKKAKKSSRPVDMPRRAFSAYNLFFADERDRILKELENEKGCGSSVDEESQDKGGESAAMALMSQSTRVRARQKKSKVKCHDMAKQIGVRWQSLSAVEKKYYQDLAVEDAVRQRAAMEEYRSKHCSESLMTDNSVRSDNIPGFESDDESLDASSEADQVKDPSAPKKPGSAFLLFSNGRRKELRRSNPELTNDDLSTMLSMMWKEAPDEVREHYLEKSRELGKRYKIEMGQWRKKASEEKNIKRGVASEDAESVQQDSKPAARKSASKKSVHHNEQETDVHSEPVSRHSSPGARAGSPGAVVTTACAKAEKPASDEEDSEPAEEELELNCDDPETPKKPETAFQAFANKRRKGLGLQYPFATEAEMCKMLTKTWRKCPQIIREKYLVEAEGRLEQYRVFHRRYLEQKGHADLANGLIDSDEGAKKESLKFRSEMKRDIEEAAKKESHKFRSETKRDIEERSASPGHQDGLDDEGACAADGSEDDGSVPSQIPSTPKNRATSTISDQITELFRKSDWDALTLANRVVDLCRIYDWAEVQASTMDCYEKCRKKDRKDLGAVVNRAEAIDTLRTKIPGVMVEKQRRDLVADFIEALESHKIEESPFLGLNNVGILMRIVIGFATSGDFERIEEWSSRVASGHSLSLFELFQAAEASDPSVEFESRNSEAKSKFLKSLGVRLKDSKIEDLKKEREELIEATQGCEPRFSWSMPKAETESPALNEFLHSDRKGPEEIIVGGGIEFAQKLAAGARTGNTQILSKIGFSAQIEAVKSSGKHTSVVATKTRELYMAAVNEYHSNMVKLRKVCMGLRELGVKVVLLGSSELKPVARDESDEETDAHSGDSKADFKEEHEPECHEHKKDKNQAKPSSQPDPSDDDTITSNEEEVKRPITKTKRALPAAPGNTTATKDGKKSSLRARGYDKEDTKFSTKKKRSLSLGAEGKGESAKEAKRKKKTSALEAMSGRFKRRRPPTESDENSR